MADEEPTPRLLPEGTSLTREDSLDELSRFKLLSVDDLSPTKANAAESDEKIISEGTTIAYEYGDKKIISEGASIVHEYGSDEDCDDPFLDDGFGNLTQWKLSDLNKAFDKHLEDKVNEPKPKEKKKSKLEKLKWHNDRMKQYMKASLNKYNSEENLDEDLPFKFVKGVEESLIIEGRYKMYRHFNFEAMQSGTISMFFAEVIHDEGDGEVTCCKLLRDNDNARCLGCNNQGHPNLKHPVSDNAYVGGHVDCMFPFLFDSVSEDDSD